MEGEVPRTDKLAPNPQSRTNLLSRLTVSWTFGIFRNGYKRELGLDDLYAPLEEHKSHALGDSLERHWEIEFESTKLKSQSPSLLRALCRCFGRRLILYGFIMFLDNTILRIAQPLLLGRMLQYFTDDSKLSKADAWWYAGGVVLCTASSVIISNPVWLGLLHLSMKIRVACCSLMYRKTLRLSAEALQTTTVGEVANLMTNDVNRFDMGLFFIQYLWIGPVSTAIITYFLWLEIGAAALVGVLALLASIPFQMWLGKRKSDFRLKTAKRTDERIRLMNELIKAISVIKMYTWEKHFEKLVSEARIKEINEIRGSSYITGIMLSFLLFNNRLAVFCSIMTYVSMGNVITASVVYVVTSYFNLVRQMMSDFFPLAVGMAAEIFVSVQRIQTFLLYDEKTNNVAFKTPSTKFPSFNSNFNEQIYQNESLEELKNNGSLKTGNIVLENVSAKWTRESSEDTLKSLDISFPSKKLSVVIGPVGCGKSSLLQVVLRELSVSRGSLQVSGLVSYAAQEPWLFEASVRQNILFGSPYNESRYHSVVRACALLTDFQQLSQGDRTWVGERGVILSGGQRARINLARAVYREADIYLLDDPLSAVDSHVAKQLFEQCISEFLKQKTVILATHQLQFLKFADYVILLQNGKVGSQGSYEDLQLTNSNFRNTTSLVEVKDGSSSENEVKVEGEVEAQFMTAEPEQEGKSEGSVSGQVFLSYLRGAGQHPSTSTSFQHPSTSTSLICLNSYILLMQVEGEVEAQFVTAEPEQEGKSVGSVSGQVFLSYLRGGGHWISLICLNSYILLMQVEGEVEAQFVTAEPEQEGKSEGSVSGQVFLSYLRGGGHWVSLICLNSYILLMQVEGEVEAQFVTAEPEQEGKSEGSVSGQVFLSCLRGGGHWISLICLNSYILLMQVEGEVEAQFVTAEPEQEGKSEGSVSGQVFLSYLRGGGHWISMIILLFMFCLTQFIASASDYWLNIWVNLEQYGYSEQRATINERKITFHLSQEWCITIFAALIIATIVISLLRSFLFFFMCMRSSIRLHDTMFSSIIGASIRFFHTNSSGRILNRFTRDIGAIDELLPSALLDVLQIALTVVGIVGLSTIVNVWLLLPTFCVAAIFYYLRNLYLRSSCGIDMKHIRVLLQIALTVVGIVGLSTIVNVWLLLPTFCVAAIFYYLRNLYLRSSCGIKRLEGITRSPVFSHLNGTFQGLSTIRAFTKEEILIKEFDDHQDLHSSASYLFLTTTRAFGYWLDVVCFLYIAIVTFSFLVIDSSWLGGDVGLAITQTAGLVGVFQWGMKQSADVETFMTSVERVLEFTKIEQEPLLESAPVSDHNQIQPPLEWPLEGKITFENVEVSYSTALPPVLKSISFTVQPREKIGIVGRTGAGKSTLTAALFRLTPAIKGTISIDNRDIQTVGLHEVRSKISIIPQEPILFSGSVRKNLDPFGEYPDHVVWNALEEVELKGLVEAIPEGLNSVITEGGSNLSVGQRQLMCLARAIIRNNKILLMDEATANVDSQTDALIQSTIRRRFAACTVLTIAHRLVTVIDSDRIMVISEGSIVEFDHPHILLNTKRGHFHAMVEQLGRTTAECLHKSAASSFQDHVR